MAATVAGVAITARSVSNITWPPLPVAGDARLEAYRDSTDAPAAGTTAKTSSACAAVAGSGHPGDTQVLNQGLFRQAVHPVQQRLHLDTEQPDQGRMGRRAPGWSVRGETGDPVPTAARTPSGVARSSSGWVPPGLGRPRAWARPGFGLPAPPHLTGGGLIAGHPRARSRHRGRTGPGRRQARPAPAARSPHRGSPPSWPCHRGRC